MMKTKVEIVRVAVFNREDASPPTKLTVSYKGWWHLTKLHVPLALEVLKDGNQPASKPGQISLVQRFPDGKGPTFRVKGRNSLLEFRLYAGRSLRTRAEVNVGDLVSCTTQGVVKVPFEEKVNGKVAKAFLSLAQIAPFATPLAPPRDIFPYRYKRDPNSSVPLCTFPLGEYVPTQARLQFLVKEMYGYGPMPDPDDWHHKSPQISPADCDVGFVQLWEKVFGDQSDS